MLLTPITTFNTAQIQPAKSKPAQNKFVSGVNSDVFVKSTSFTGSDPDAETIKRVMAHTTCPCCGIKMSTSDDLNTLAKSSKILNGKSKDAVKFLTKYEESMLPIEKEVFQILKKESKNTPNDSIQEILQRIKEPHLEKLGEEQFAVLKRIDKVASQLPKEEGLRVKFITKEARLQILANKKDDIFKRKDLSKDLQTNLKSLKDNENVKKINYLTTTLPNSSNDIHSFIVKYSRRSSKETAMRLVKMSQGTIEHVKPQYHGGEDKASNYILECANCNNNRGAIRFDKWVEVYPQMPENAQKYIDTVIEKINNGEMKGFETYPNDVAETLEDESKGAIKLDTSKLKKCEEKENMTQKLTNLLNKYKKKK